MAEVVDVEQIEPDSLVFPIGLRIGRPCALVTFPVGRPYSRLSRFKARFPKARPGRVFLTWIVPGPMALRRLAKWIEDERDLTAAEARQARARAADREWEEALHGH